MSETRQRTLPAEAVERLTHANMLRRTKRYAEYMAAMKDVEWLLMGASQETRDALFGDPHSAAISNRRDTMRLCLAIIALSLTGACSRPDPQPVPSYIPADLLTPCVFSPGGPSETEGDLAAKVVRLLSTNACNAQKITSIAEIVGGPQCSSYC